MDGAVGLGAYSLVVSPVARNILAVLAAVIAAYIALAIAATIDMAIGYPRTYSGVAAQTILWLVSLAPFLVAAAVLGAVAAAIAKPPRSRPWMLTVGVLGVGLYAASQRYIAPIWQAWLETVIAAAIAGAAAVCAFWLLARRTNGTGRAAPTVIS